MNQVGEMALKYAAGEDVVFDQQLVQYECLTNQAHVVMLKKQGLISSLVAKKLVAGLEEIKKLDQQGKFKLKPELEDVHSNVEQWLIDKLGIEIGGWLRLGIARNDQVYTDTRMWLKDELLVVAKELVSLMTGLVKVAKQHTKTVMPGYTHWRVSQPITYGHWLTAKAYHFGDDLSHILTTFDSINSCPLGIFEMAGTHLPLDRQLTAKLLGFARVTPNSLYTANQRGELEIKLLADLSLLALHIRRTMNEVIIWSSHEFGLVKVDDLYTSGGTAQPNLKNPDVLEVVRAKMAGIWGKLVTLLAIMDPLPSGYNRDTQATKPVIFEAIKDMQQALPVVEGILTSLKPDKQRMVKVAGMNFSVAPDVAVQLAVEDGISFRQAYQKVKLMIGKGKKLKLSPKAAALGHVSPGGSAPAEVKKQIKQLKQQFQVVGKKIGEKETLIKEGWKLLEQEVGKLIKEEL
ncbi:MAG: argininosuccinate lyase [Candidatus Chisholmbacteria bacterium RIFCSPHIGHO2_01_FULL_48_12]|uniref:Argininosuccinate lyase n=1 Tax=Candidatus Chisholmbacteria bacterium RIFCSPHIGHO2_01_FULL_48_12 TaxID=1797589 RepID=A0A1G1VPU0_9BACT|nr:MAG: argininosuccinate lyase [Candidatus Chisholmbacteria bacterium RIFCSPHIGHO2_01_FULL_48_12]